MDGQTISQYRIVEKLGGRMGVVYKAEDVKLDSIGADVPHLRVFQWAIKEFHVFETFAWRNFDAAPRYW